MARIVDRLSLSACHELLDAAVALGMSERIFAGFGTSTRLKGGRVWVDNGGPASGRRGEEEIEWVIERSRRAISI